MNTCKNCNEPLNGNFCSNCGQPAKLRRIDGKYIIEEIFDFLFANKGLLYTAKKVLINPGESVRYFIKEDRYRFMKPVTFLFITSLIYAIVNQLFSITAEDYYQQYNDFEGSTVGLFFKWMLIDYPGYTGVITGFFMALWVKIFFRKYGYNIFEIFILLCFITGLTTLYISLVAIIQGLTHIKIIQESTYIGAIYLTWAIGHFFDKKKVTSYIKAFLSYIFASMVLGIIILVVGTLVDVVMAVK